MKKTILALIILTSQYSFSGGANAHFSCKSASGRTTLEATVPGDYEEHSVEFNIDGEEVKWFSGVNQDTYEVEENSSLFVLGTLRNKNLHFIAINDKGQKVLTFTAVPSSIEIKYGEKGTLTAEIQGLDPRDGKLQSPIITVNCSYSYEI